MWLWVRVEERPDVAHAGQILGSDGPEPYTYPAPLKMDIEGIANGDNRVVVVEAREGANPGLPVLFYGVSEPFSLRPGKRVVAEVPMVLQLPESQAPDSTVELLFDGEPRTRISADMVGNATLLTRSSGATAMVLSNDESFTANLTTLELSDDRLACEIEQDGDVEWRVCKLVPWDLSAGLGELHDGPLTVFVKFIDRYGYESQVNKATVTLDTSGPLVVLAAISPETTRPGGTVSVTATFHETLHADPSLAVLTAVPSLPPGSDVSAMQRVGESNTYLWTLTIGEDDQAQQQTYAFDVEASDALGNPADEPQPLLDSNNDPLLLHVDPAAPLLTNFAEIALPQTLFGTPDVGASIEFDMTFAEESPWPVVDDSGTCAGTCPQVRLGNRELGAVALQANQDESGELSFQYQYTVAEEDWAGGDKEVAITISWTDAAGNALEVELPDRPRFDFLAPTAYSCKLLPASGNVETLFTYSLTASEPLSTTPVLKVEAEAPGLFDAPPVVSADGYSYLWEQSAAGLGSQSFELSVQLTDLAGNVSGDGSSEESVTSYICPAQATLDGVPPKVFGVALTTIPSIVVEGDPVLAVREGGIIEAAFDVEESQGLMTTPAVSLNVPGAPVPFTPTTDGVGCVLTGDETYHCQYSLQVDASLLAESGLSLETAEGFWTVKAVLVDEAGNTTTKEDLGSQLVRLDFTPPTAECTLVPTPNEAGYPIGQKVTFVATPLEAYTGYFDDPGSALKVNFFDGDGMPVDVPMVFGYTDDSQFQYVAVVPNAMGDASFEVALGLSDLVGNHSSNICAKGKTKGWIDGTVPEIATEPEPFLVVDDGAVDPEKTPLKVGRIVDAHFTVVGTDIPPNVYLGTGVMTPKESVENPVPGGQPGAFSWVYTATLNGSEGVGEQYVTISGFDAAGNSYQFDAESASATLDFAPPVAQCLVNIPNAGAGDQVELTVTSSEALQSPPEISSAMAWELDDELSSPDAQSPRYVFVHEVQPGDDLQPWTVSVTAHDLAGNPDPEFVLCEAAGTVDGKAIEIAGETTYARHADPALSDGFAVTGDKANAQSEVIVRFTPAEPPASMEVKVGKVVVAAHEVVAGEYIFNHPLNGAGDHGDVLPVTVELFDAANNSTFVTVGAITLDYQPPAIAWTPYFERCDTYPSARLAQNDLWVKGAMCDPQERYTFSPTCDGLDPVSGELLIEFSVTEEYILDALAIEVVDPAGSRPLKVDPCLSTATHARAVYLPDGSESEYDGDMCTTVVVAHLVDIAGNSADVQLGCLRFDYTPPPAADVDTPDRIVYERNSWGSQATQGQPMFTLYGDPGAMEAGVRVLLYNEADPVEALLLGETTADDQGRIGGGLAGEGFKIPPSSLPLLYILAMDAAGNTSDADGDKPGHQGILVRDNRWLATLGKKVAGMTSHNPHRFLETPWFQWHLAQQDSEERGDVDGIAASNAKSVTSTGAHLSLERVDSGDGVPPYEARFPLHYSGPDGKTVARDSWSWDGRRWSYKKAPVTPGDGSVPAEGAAMAYDTHRQAVWLFGGLANDEPLAKTWSWNGQIWQKIVPADPEKDGNPSRRSNAGMVYDSGRDVVVLFGGLDENGKLLGDTWEWDGLSWRQVAPPGQDTPAPRIGAGFAYDLTRDRAVLFGGSGSGAYLGDTWEWDGDTWYAAHNGDPDGLLAPEPRRGAALVFDHANEAMFLFGGMTYDPAVGSHRLGDSWYWDGQTWLEVVPDDPEKDGNPPPRHSIPMAYDVGRNRVVLFGGDRYYFDKFWMWNGSSWENGGPSSALFKLPEARADANLVYDPHTQNSHLLFGRRESFQDLLDQYGVWFGFDWSVASSGAQERPENRFRAPMLWVPNLAGGSHLLFGGKYLSPWPWMYLKDTWLYQYPDWTEVKVQDKLGDGGPNPGDPPKFFYDTVADAAMLYDSGSLWQFLVTEQQGVVSYEWARVHNASPGINDNEPWDAQVAWDPVRERLVAFERWLPYEWNGTKWSGPIQPKDPEKDGNPGESLDAGAPLCEPLYDPVPGRIVLYCIDGHVQATAYNPTFWTWDGISFHRLTTADPTGDGNPEAAYAAIARDPFRNEINVVGGEKIVGNDKPVTDEHWTGVWGEQERPGHLLSIDFASAGHCTAPVFEKLSVNWVGGGTGFPETDGANLYLWDEGRWLLVDGNDSPTDDPGPIAWSSDDPLQVNRVVVGNDQLLHLALLPTGGNSVPHLSTVSTDYVEVILEYRIQAADEALCQ